MKIGYVGLGVMGGALARRLLLSHKLHVFDINEQAKAGLTALGAIPADSLTDLARTCDVVFICVPRSAHVREAIFGPRGLRDGLERGKIVVDQTSGDPTETRRMAADLAALGIAMLDAPVSGGARGAEAGTIAIMVGGADAEYQRILPIFQSISPNIFHCGAIGAGQVLKLVNNTISTCNRFAMLEGVALAIKNGLNPTTICEVLNAGGARSKSTENLLPALVQGKASAQFALSLMLKDVNLAAGLAVETGVPLLFGQVARSMLQAASNTFGDSANIDDIADLVADQAGIKFHSGNTAR